MPELPEVETIRRFLKKHILNKQISAVKIRLDKIVHEDKGQFIKHLRKSSITDIKRQGKYFIFVLSNGYYLIIHLKMSGQILYVPHETEIIKHTHVIISFKGSNFDLRFKDVRQFGYLLTLRDNELSKYLSARIGPDVLDVSLLEFKKTLKSRNRIIKSLLLDQKLYAGIGNIYANEALFIAGIHPESKSSSLSDAQISKLYKALEDVLKLAIKLGGSSVGDYILPDNSIGSFQKKHKIYQKDGEACPVCKTNIKRIKQNGRSTWYCPKCQKIKKFN
jgi:formamidopyrimidine-DNA glycosylase